MPRKAIVKKTVPKKKIPEEEPLQEENEVEETPQSETSQSEVEVETPQAEEETQPKPKRRGRPKGSTAKKTPAKKDAAASSSETASSSTKTASTQRTFKILFETIEPDDGSPEIEDENLKKNGGKYSGRTPLQAAKKAFTRLCKSSGTKEECGYTFSIQETTTGSAQKTFRYHGLHSRLENPQEMKKGDAVYYINFNNIVKAYREPKSSE